MKISRGVSDEIYKTISNYFDGDSHWINIKIFTSITSASKYLWSGSYVSVINDKSNKTRSGKRNRGILD